MLPRFHNPALEALADDNSYTPEQIERIRRTLEQQGALDFTPLSTGLYPASGSTQPGASGYDNVWVRDNVYVAVALWESGRPGAAAAVAESLLAFYSRHRHRFEARAREVMDRPHVRFDGATLAEIAGQQWPHAQNDALGYCLWLCARLATAGVLSLDRGQFDTLVLLADYFSVVGYWEDEDSGHWEETRKISASSIGVVVAGLRAWIDCLRTSPDLSAPDEVRSGLTAKAEAAAERGSRALAAILPAECVQPSPLQNRRYDAALLFLIFPLNVVTGDLTDTILEDVRTKLLGEVGIRRYLGDSYWAPDYDRLLADEERTRDFSNDIETRDALLPKIGDEAQWCLFDPLMSALYGHRYLTGRRRQDFGAQRFHFNRSLAQITPDWRCPELYYWQRGDLSPNPHTPLLWTQANLVLALKAMRETVALNTTLSGK